MDAALLWTIIGSVAGVAAVLTILVQIVLPGRARRHKARAAGPLRIRPRRWPWQRRRGPLIANAAPAKLTPRFVGRADLLGKLLTALKAPRPVVLYGLGGVGKTQLALTYLQANQRRYDLVWWIRAEQQATLDSDLVALARALRLPEAADVDQQVDQQRALAAVRAWLAGNGGWLLVCDNAPGDDTLELLGPLGRRGRVLLTSRNQVWRDAAMVWVAPWTPAESVAFLQASLADHPAAGLDQQVAEQLAAELGHLPLALEQAVAYVRAAKQPLDSYLALVRTRPHEVFALSDVPDDERAVAKTWALSLEAVAPTPGAAELLVLCAFLAPDQIPRDLIHAGAKQLAVPLGGVAADPVALDRAVMTLRRYSLIDATDQTLGVHRLVQAVVRDQLNPDDQQTWAANAVRLLNAAFLCKRDDLSTWAACERLLTHGLVAAGHAGRFGAELKATGRLLNETGLYLRRRARFVEARAALERAVTIAETAYGPDHANVAVVRNNLGNVLQDLGDPIGASRQFDRALTIDRAAYGPDDPPLTIRRNNRGSALLDLGDLAGAQAEEAVASTEAAYRLDRPTVAIYRRFQGQVRWALKDLAGARTHFERALAIHEAVYGPDSPTVAIDRDWLGVVLRDLGDLAGARAQHERALAITEAFYGPDHRDVASRRSSLGHTLRALGDLAGAQAQYERALTIAEAIYGSDHFYVAGIRNDLKRLPNRSAT